MMNPYMKRRCSKEAVTYYHPLLEPVPERTIRAFRCFRSSSSAWP